MNLKIRKKIKILILLKLIIFGYLIILYYNNHNNRIKSFDFLQYYLNKIKTFKFVIENKKNFQINIKIDLDYENVNFAVIRRPSCPSCGGLFSNYVAYLGCIRKYLNEGFIPILEFVSYKNTINGFIVDPTKGNPWEYFFNQPFGYEYNNIIRKAKNITYFECNSSKVIRPNLDIYLNQTTLNYWHIFVNKYIPIKNEIINESNNIIKIIFKDSKNILGVLLRGTDYIAMKPATEDNNIRDIFLKSIGIKVKCLLSKTKISYNYSTKKPLAYNINFKSNLDFNKIYLLNIIILSKCLDLLTAKTSGTTGIFILTEGFRYYKVYNLGLYK